MEQARRVVRSQATGGVLLMFAAFVALGWANSPWHESYHDLWFMEAGVFFGSFSLVKPLELWVNDGLMAIFFFVVGLEIKREMRVGHLSTLRSAGLPLAAAVGGMLVPALIFTAINHGGSGSAGWGVPMATDIAFAMGVLALLGSRVPLGLKVFLVALAVIDDLGAIAVIAVFYANEIHAGLLATGVLFLGLSFLLNRLGVRVWWPYAFIGVIGCWLAFLKSGVHATVAGVLMAFTIPFDRRSDEDESLSARLQHGLEPWVNLIVMPIFALANAGVRFEGSALAALQDPVALGIIAGLVLGKPAGVIVFSLLAVRFAGGRLPDGVKWSQIVAASLLAGIGFTMSLFIAGQAFPDGALLASAKVGVLVASLLAGVAGTLLLWRTCRPGAETAGVPAS